MPLFLKLLPLLPVTTLCLFSAGMRVAHDATEMVSAHDAATAMAQSAVRPQITLFGSSAQIGHGDGVREGVISLVVVGVDAGEDGKQRVRFSNGVTACMLNETEGRLYAGRQVDVHVSLSPPKPSRRPATTSRWFASLAPVSGG